MNTQNFPLPLEELSIAELYCTDNTVTYEVPIYQRNYAWEEDQIKTLVQDVYDAYTSDKPTYYIGTLVTFDKGGRTYEVIDGQQRLTTIFLILKVLEQQPKCRLTYRARKKSKDTLLQLGQLDKLEDKDKGIATGYKSANDVIAEIVGKERNGFTVYFLNRVHMVHYKVPKDVDLNHYFEVMNSRGEQLEKHEIVKATLCAKLNQQDMAKFNRVWEACSNMNLYIQQAYQEKSVFGEDLFKFPDIDFDALPIVTDDASGKKSISELLSGGNAGAPRNGKEEQDNTFEPIIDFSNFLLIVLKITRMDEPGFIPTDFTLDDKELIKEFGKVRLDEQFAKKFATNLLKAKYLLDNYTTHHTDGKESVDANPWQLEHYAYENGKGDTRNLVGKDRQDVQNELVQLLSMFEVTFSAHQRKNYLFYCLLFLFGNREPQVYLEFLRGLADKYFRDVYLCPERLSETNNRPKPNSFDEVVLHDNHLCTSIENRSPSFESIYGDGSEESKGIQLFVFNYTDYKLWKKYADEMRGCKYKEENIDRIRFFAELGCSDFGFDTFNKFYFSRTRKSLEHFYPQAKVGKDNILSKAQINCFGNFAMIGADANSSGSDWNPKTKLDHYTDSKHDQVSVASLKFKIMMQICRDNARDENRESGEEWNFIDIRKHQEKMTAILLR